VCSISAFINGSLTVVESAITSTGRVQFALLSNKYYSLLCSKSGYADATLVLNPILFNSYDVVMSTVGVSSVVPTGFATISSGTFRSSVNNNFSIMFSSPYSSFVSYQYVVSYPSGSFNSSGSSVSGETFNRLFNTSSSFGDTVDVTYGWVLDNGVAQNFTVRYLIVRTVVTPTLTSDPGGDYGFLVGDRVFLFTVIAILVVGVSWLAVGFFGALVTFIILIGLFNQSSLLSHGASNFFIVSIVVVGFLIIFRGRQ